MAEPLYRQLLVQARRLARTDARRPQQGNLRRAVSSAYYAIFHLLIEEAGRFLLGATASRARLRKIIARAFTHAEMASAARTFAGGTLPAALNRKLGAIPIPPRLQEFAEQFVATQEMRHIADYDLSESFSRDEVIKFIDRVERVVDDWPTLRTDPASEFFLLALLIWSRIRER